MHAPRVTTQSLLRKAGRQRWASITLHQRALALLHDGEITRGFRAERASERCRILANSNLHIATRLARTA